MSANVHSMNNPFQSETALVLFSGGQDSATCLAWALQRFARVEMLGFNYGQRHAIELECRDRLLDGIKSLRPDWAAKLGESHTLEIPTLADDFRHRADARCRDRDGRGRPAQHVRARPQSGVPDLRRRAGLPARHHATSSAACARPIIPAIRIAATRPSRRCSRALNLGMARPFELHTPLMWLDKAGDLEACARTRRGRAGRPDPRTLPHLLSRRARRAARLGLWLRRMPGLRVARQGLARICGDVFGLVESERVR